MKISKTTFNFAQRRNVELIVDEDTISFYPFDDDCGEPAFSYSIQETGLFFKGNIWLKPEVKEDLPHWIMNEKMLRNLIDFVSPHLQED
ncbi:hypothetical protein C408_1389 [Vibrio diabolicus E0666]|uniref:hypothetical protein n=1 Tax=Vibrio diabolicus TaxID=50719 RepID=UPI0002B70617|nr:hypothetical protein [Vibrio diabolicus]EMD80173.1 hypothetical protein C408_1389 [Vibrio diabolicus E0666]